MNALNPGTHGIRLPLGTRVPDRIHARNGGNPYPKEMREMVLQVWLNSGGDNGGLDALDTPHYNQLRFQGKFPAMITIERWIEIHKNEGHVLPKRATGNAHSSREIQGEALVQLAIYRLVRPKAYLDEVIAYLHNRDPANMPYSQSQVIRAEHRLGLWLKVGSTTSNLAYLPVNLEKRRCYGQWARDEADKDKTIDIDEAKFKEETQDRKRGKITKCRRCNSRGLYRKGSRGVDLLMCVCGSDQNPFSFHRMFTEGTTDLYRFFQYMSDLIDWLDNHRPGESYTFTMDNLSCHKHPMVLNLIQNAGHRVKFRAPYWSCDGPIEYVFNSIQVHLQMDFDGVVSTVDLMDEIDDIIFIMDTGGYSQYFIHCGFN